MALQYLTHSDGLAPLQVYRLRALRDFVDTTLCARSRASPCATRSCYVPLQLTRAGRLPCTSGRLRSHRRAVLAVDPPAYGRIFSRSGASRAKADKPPARTLALAYATAYGGDVEATRAEANLW